MERQRYDSDITRGQYERIRTMSENAKKKTRPRQVDLYDVFCAMLYVLRNGIKWRALPHDFPRWGKVYRYFEPWSRVDEGQETSLLERALKKSGGARAREQGQASLDKLLHRRCAKRQEYRYCAEKAMMRVKRYRALSVISRWIRKDYRMPSR